MIKYILGMIVFILAACGPTEQQVRETAIAEQRAEEAERNCKMGGGAIVTDRFSYRWCVVGARPVADYAIPEDQHD